MSAVQFHVPGIPQGKGRARASSRGGFVRLYTPAKTRAYEETFADAARAAMAGRAPFTGPIAVTFEAVFPVAKSAGKRERGYKLNGDIVPTVKPDWDNIAKCSDAMNGIVWTDDKQVADGRVIKRYGETPGVWVTIQPYAEIA